MDRIRSANRVIVNNLFNAERPLSDLEAKQLGLQVNVNWGEGSVLASQARRQFTNAFERPARYFKVSIPSAPVEKQQEWETFVTQFINRKLKNSKSYYSVGQNRWASVVAHGIGPMMWADKENWLPEYVGVDDLRMPTNTLTDLSNVDWFAIRVWYTEGELAAKAFGKYTSKYWNKPAVQDILDRIHDNNYETTDYRWVNSPEKMAELIRQNGGYYSSDAVPSVPMWNFYFKDRQDDGSEIWKLRVVVDTDLSTVGDPNQFLYDSGDKSHGSSLDQLLHIQFGDMNNKAPFLYHSVRSLGFLLVEPCFWTNMNRCKLLQHLMQQYNTWFKIADPSGRARAQKIETFDKCIIEDGVSVVPQSERHQVDANLIEMVTSQLKQLMVEASASSTAQADTGTNKEQTAYETAIKASQVNAMMSGILLNAVRQEKFAYMEICRRFCIRDSANEDVRKFQKLAEDVGIPKIYLNIEMWEIEPEQSLGGGNPTMEMAQAQALITNRGLFGPEAQQTILHQYVLATTGNSGLAQELAPVGVAPVATDGQKWAASIFGSLMQGVPVVQNEAVTAAEQLPTLMGMLGGAIHICEQQGNVCTRPQLNGFTATLGYCQQLVAQIATDPAQGPLAKQYSQQLGELANILRGFGQRLAEQDAAGQRDPEAEAKIAMAAQKSQQSLTASQERHQQSLVHQQQRFDAEQKNAAERHAMQQQIDAQKAAMDAVLAKMEAETAKRKAEIEIAISTALANHEVQMAKKKASEGPKDPQTPSA